MNSENDAFLNDDDAELGKMLSVLKNLQPTLEGRIEYRTTVAHELAKLRGDLLRPTQAPWWRSFSLLFPLALSVSVGVMTALVIMAGREKRVVDIPRDSVPAAPAQDVEVIPQQSVPRESSSDRPVFDRRYTTTYLCGVGELVVTSQEIFRETR